MYGKMGKGNGDERAEYQLRLGVKNNRVVFRGKLTLLVLTGILSKETIQWHPIA